MEVRGQVERKRVARGSKSEHDAIVLRTPRRTWWLRKRGGHPFHDPSLAPLVGRQLRAEGSPAGPWFILDRWATEGRAKRKATVAKQAKPAKPRAKRTRAKK